jgi:hypothetical protein
MNLSLAGIHACWAVLAHYRSLESPLLTRVRAQRVEQSFASRFILLGLSAAGNNLKRTSNYGCLRRALAEAGSNCQLQLQRSGNQQDAEWGAMEDKDDDDRLSQTRLPCTTGTGLRLRTRVTL